MIKGRKRNPVLGQQGIGERAWVRALLLHYRGSVSLYTLNWLTLEPLHGMTSKVVCDSNTTYENPFRFQLFHFWSSFLLTHILGSSKMMAQVLDSLLPTSRWGSTWPILASAWPYPSYCSDLQGELKIDHLSVCFCLQPPLSVSLSPLPPSLPFSHSFNERKTKYIFKKYGWRSQRDGASG